MYRGPLYGAETVRDIAAFILLHPGHPVCESLRPSPSRSNKWGVRSQEVAGGPGESLTDRSFFCVLFVPAALSSSFCVSRAFLSRARPASSREGGREFGKISD